MANEVAFELKVNYYEQVKSLERYSESYEKIVQLK
jgi:hypothetical protein